MLNGITETFTDQNLSENQLNEAARAELYTRIYKWAAEDFTTVKDMKDFVEDLLRWARTVERRMSRLGYNLASHSHYIPVHYHAGAGPQVGGTRTLQPTSPDRLKWPQEEMFKIIENTTGATSNLRKNKIKDDRNPKIGDMDFGRVGRELEIPVLQQKRNLNSVIIKTS